MSFCQPRTPARTHARWCTQQVIRFEHDPHLLHIQLHLLCSRWRFNVPRCATKPQKNDGFQLPTLRQTSCRSTVQIRKQMLHNLDPFIEILFYCALNTSPRQKQNNLRLFFLTVVNGRQLPSQHLNITKNAMIFF